MDYFDNLQDREKNILALVFVALVVCLYLFLTSPLIEKNGEIKTEIKEIEKALEAPKVKAKDLEKMQKEINAIKYQINRLKLQIPKTEKRGFLIRDLESITKLNNIEIISFIPKEAISVTLGGQEITSKLKRYLKRKKKASVKGKVLKTAINIDSTGDFQDYKKLFEDVMTYYRAVEVADITISKAGTGDRGVDKRFGQKRKRVENILDQFANNTLNVSFTLFAYTLIPDEPKKEVKKK